MTKKTMDAAGLRQFLLGGCDYLGSKKDQVNALNVFPVPDGDTGINMYLTVSSAGKKLAAVDDTVGVGKLAQEFSQGTLMGARGNSGVILSQIFRGLATSMAGKKEVTAAELAAALQKGVDLSYKSVMKPVEGTILTVFREFSAAAESAAAKKADIDDMLQIALKAGHESLDRTPELLPALKTAGVVDAGGMGLLVFMEGAAAAFAGEPLVSAEEVAASFAAETPKQAAALSEEEIVYTFCTQLLIKGENLSADTIRDRLSRRPKGDSLLVVGDESVLKLHFHTNEPWEVLEYCSHFGMITDIIIDNMREQHDETRAALEEEQRKSLMGDETQTAAANASAAPETELEAAPCGVIAVCSGDGMAEIFRTLGASVISGGQTMNPSAEDILEAIAANPAEEMVILPNNGNIVLTAQQAQKLAEKKVEVLPCKYVTQGVNAMMGFVPENSAAENLAAMMESCDSVVNGELTYAVRDTNINEFEIKEGDILGIMQGDIVACGKDRNATLRQVVDKMLAANEEAFMISLYYGEDVTEEDAAAVRDELQEAYGDLEVELARGGQPLYYFLISVE